jgi:hypothetical protein
VLDLVRLTDQPFERFVREEARDRQTSDGDEQRWTNDPQLGVEPDRARFLFRGRRNSVAATASDSARENTA